MSNDAYKPVFETALDDYNAMVSGATKAPAQPSYYQQPSRGSGGGFSMGGGQESGGEFSKGFSRSFAEIPGLLAGLGAYAADVVGADQARDAMLQFAKDRQEFVEQNYGSDNASFSNVLEGKADPWKFLQNASGYVTGQAIQSIATAGGGSLIAKGLLKSGAAAAGERFAAEQLAKGVAPKAAQEATKQFLEAEAKRIGLSGAGAGMGAQNLTMEVGSIYPEAVDQAKKEGRELDAGDLARVGVAGAGAAAVETAMDKFALGKILGGSKSGGSMPARAAREIPAGMARESLTEGVQTGMERYGAGQSLNDADAWRDYIDSMAVGAIGGAQAGAITSLHRDQQPPAPVPNPLEAVAAKAAEPNSPLSKAAMAGNAGAASQAAAAAQPTPDPISDRAAAVYADLDQPGMIDKIRGFGPDTSNEFLYALGIARNPNLDPRVREQAINQVEQVLATAKSGTGFVMQNEAPKQPGTALTVPPTTGTAVAPADLNGEFFDPNTIDGEAVRVDNMLPGPKALPGPQRGLTTRQPTQEQAAPATEAAAAPVAQQTVAQGNTPLDAARAIDQAGVTSMTEVQAPRVETPAGAGPAVLRKRKAVVQQLAENGFETVQRDGNQFWMVNSKTGQKFKLDGPADAQLARKAINDRIDALAHTAAASPKNDLAEPTEAQIAAGNYKKSDVIELNGMKIKIENPQGSIRRGTSPDGKAWETKMAHHYGEFQGTVGADGDKLDVFLGPRKDSDKIYVIDQVNKDGSFDEHKVMMGFTTEADARAGYLANYEPGWTGLGAITEMSPEEFKTWSKSRAAKKPLSAAVAAGKSAENFTEAEKKEESNFFTFKANGKQHNLKILKPGDLPKNPSAKRGDAPRALSQAEADMIQKVAGLLGKQVVFYEAQDGRIGDGFVFSGQPNTIFVASETTVNPLAVFGHEFFHTLRATNPEAWNAIAAVVRTKVSNPQGFRENYYGAEKAEERGSTPLSEDQGGELEELVSDLGGNLLKDKNFWGEVFAKIKAENPKEAKSIIAKLSTQVKRLIDRLVKALNQPGFQADRFVKDLDQVRSAFADAMAAYLKDSGINQRAMAAEQLKAEQKIKKSEDRPEGLTVTGYHFSKQPRETLSTAFYGTGLKGSARDEIMANPDERLRQRLSFYFDKGTGVRPEAGVGGIAHKATLTNIYDADADPLKLKGGNARAFESKVLDAGYKGYLTRLEGSQPGQVILLGKQTIKPEILGPMSRIEGNEQPTATETKAEPVKKGLMSKELDAINVDAIPGATLRSGTLTVPADSIEQANAEFERIGSSIRFSPEREADAARAKREYAEVEAKYKGTDQWMKAPDGTDTKLSERQWVQVRTPSFKQWFGDWEQAHKDGGVWATDLDVSKVVDKNGEPLVVYHGASRGGFMKFEKPGGTGRGDLGIWTADDVGMAASYVRRNRMHMVEDPEVGEQTGWIYVSNETGKALFTMGLADSPETIAEREKTNNATAEPLYGKRPYPGDQPGVYALFINTRNPQESYFEGANWDGSRHGQYQVVDQDGELQYTKDGQAYFEMFDDANEFAKTVDGSEVQPASSHYETTDGVVKEARKYNHDGAIIRDVVDDGGGPGYSGEPANIFVAFDPNQVKSADFNNGAFSVDSDDIRFAADRKPAKKPAKSKQEVAIGDKTDISQLPKGRVVPPSAGVGSLESSLDMARSKSYKRGRDLKVDLQERVLKAAKEAKVDLNAHTQETFKFLSDLVFEDAKFALKSNENAIGWYDSKISRALGAIAMVHPEVNKDPLSRLAFLWALAVTSNGVKVNMNFNLAERAYSAWKDSDPNPEKRVMPNNIGIGNAASAIKDGLEMFNLLGKKFGSERLAKFMVTNFTVGEIERMIGESVGGEWKSTPVRGAAILGPKIGNGFFSNLNGFFDALTMDRWLMRTYGRLTGTLLGVTKQDIDKSRAKLETAIAALSNEERQTLGKTIGVRINKNLTRADVDRIATASQKASMKKDKRAVMQSTPAMDTFRKNANNHHMTMDGQKEAPSGPAERNWIRAIFADALAKLESDGKGMTMSDLQALLWYPERRLYDAAKSEEDISNGYEDDEAPDYANAALDMAVRAGFDRARVVQAMDAAEAKGTVKGTPLTADEKAAMIDEFRAPPKQTQHFAFEVAPDPDDAELTAAWEALPIKERARITKLVKEAVVDDIVALTGVETGKVVGATGSFMGSINPNLLSEFKKTKVSIEQARGLASALGFVLDQNSVALVDERASGTNGMVRITFDGSVEKYLPQVYAAIRAAVPGVDFTSRGRNVDILNFTGMSNDELASRIEGALEGLEIPLEAFTTYGEINSELVEKADYESHIEGLRPAAGQEIRAGLGQLRDRARAIVAAEVRNDGGAGPGSGPGGPGRGRVEPGQAPQAREVSGTTSGPEAFTAADVEAAARDGQYDGDVRFTRDRNYTPKKTVTAYKLFRMDARRPGQLFPLFVLADQAVPMGEWLKAEIGPMTGEKVKSKLGPLAFRPGWHAGDLPIATHIGMKANPSDTKPTLRNPEHVWAEIEMAADVDWQEEANKRGTNKVGKIVPVKAHITDQIPERGFYRYKTNSNMTGNWLIGGEMRVNRILSDDEVKAINEAAGAADLQRKEPLDLAKYGFDDARMSTDRMTETPEFVRWFGDSQVVDVDGNPLVLYHATGRSFDEFKTNRSELGSHFGTIEQAEQVAGMKESASVMPVYLRIENPLRLQDLGSFAPHLVAEQLLDLGLMSEAEADAINKAVNDEGVPESRLTPKIQQAIRRGGYDGVVYLNRREGVNPFGPDGVSGEELDQMSDEEVIEMFPGAQDSWIVFRPEQIKSAIGNNGEFSSNEPSILKSVDRTDTAEFKRWSRNAPLVLAKDALSYDFQTGKPFVAQTYHGTNAEDDFTEFDLERGGNQTAAESAGMGIFSTSEPVVAGEYAKNLGFGRYLGLAFRGSEDLRQDPEAVRLQQKVDDARKAVSQAGYDAVTDTIPYLGDVAKGKSEELKRKLAASLMDIAPGAEERMAKIQDATNDLFAAEKELSNYIADYESLKIPQRIMPLYVRMANPKVYDAKGQTPGDFPLSERIAAAKRAGHDGVVFKNIADPSPVAVHYVSFNPNDIKSAVGNNGEYSESASINLSADRPWFDDLSNLKVTANYNLGDLLKTSKKLSWWDRTIGTQFNLAKKHPAFKRVFDAVQRFINDVSAYATRAADLAPNILPKLESWKDIGKTPLSAEDVKALRDPIFGGTLKYMRDDDGNIVETDDVDKAGVVFTNDELKERFGLNSRQIGLYREFRRATNKSLSDLAVSDMLRYLGEDGMGVRQQALDAKNLDGALDAMVAHLDQLIEQQPERAKVLEDSKRAIKEKAGQAIGLMARGYAPLSRFGQYTVYVVGKDGEQLYFSMFENERDANKMATEMKDQYPEATVTQGTMSQESYKLFSGVTPETLALFGESLGLEESGVDPKSEVFQQYLKMAKTNRSAMKRMIERKGIAGFNEDVGRVLAGFVYSNARQISTNLHAGEIGRSVQAIDQSEGDVKDQAVRLMEYVQNPREEAQAIRGLLFTQFLGGSIASALVNMTQPFTMTLPYLSQFDGVTGAAKRMAEAVKLATRGIRNDEDLAAALKRGEELGIVSPQEVHQLMAQAQGKGKLQTGDGTKAGDAAAKLNNAMAKLELGWGKVFSAAEQFNRRVTFIAAYKLARDQGMADPMKFAEEAIAETQGIYNKGNKPTWARGAVGSTLFTFKQYSIGYLEFLRRMWGNGPEGKKAVGLALAVLFLASGLSGMPGADDLDDIIDGFMQRVLGRSFDTKQAKKEFFASILGQAGAEFVMSGLSGLPGVPIDISGRMGLGNFIPGTGFFTKKRDYSRDYLEIVGPAGTLFTNIGAGVAQISQGEFGKAAEVVAPQAAQNFIKAVDMATMGYYRDLKGRKVVDVDAFDVIAKGIGFQPRAVAQVQEATGVQANLITQNKLRETEIADKWARGRIENKPGLIEDAKQELADWNRKNPESPIRIDSSQINKRVQEANKSKAQRVAATSPKEIRGSVKRELEASIRD